LVSNTYIIVSEDLCEDASEKQLQLQVMDGDC